MENEQIIRKELADMINKGNAHATFEDAVKNISKENRTKVPEKLPYSLWQLIEHIRIAQWDIIEFCKNPDHQSPEWPKEYWVDNLEPTDEQWNNTLNTIRQDRNDFLEYLADLNNHLYKPFNHGNGQNLLREAMLISDHNAYHTGEIIILRRLLNDWK
ncbi:DinB family protein [Pedobacter sp. HMF7647]|uniref:DinB family protein n=1 Tax=Hufsiella arboris TaxID=2695275 RepID=A0A7K1Y7V0_9SPHI|nr:DinB family protein [Hufsiella arboris]MXV50189.1 DinB family protein [Hufsiella arboris]